MILREHNLPKSVLSFLHTLAQHPNINRIVLFGSRAIGDHDQRADVDVAISAPTLKRGEFARLREAAYEARTLYWITLVHLELTPKALRQRIMTQGVTLYEREKTT